MKPYSLFKHIALGLTLISSMLLSAQAFSIDIKHAKEQGLVGETANGYIAQVKPGNAEAAALVKEINAQRKSVYEKIAKDNNISLTAVELRAGEKAFAKTPAGQYIFQDGQWLKK